jgi:hypothetical protein
MGNAAAIYRVNRRRGPMIPALFLGILQIAVGIDTLVTHIVLPVSAGALTTVASILFMAIGVALISFVIASLVVGRPIVEVTDEGLALGVTQPGQPPLLIGWVALKGAEVGYAGKKAGRRDDPLCLIVRFAGNRVAQPAQLVGVQHSTKGSIFLRASHLDQPAQAVADRLNALHKEHASR